MATGLGLFLASGIVSDVAFANIEVKYPTLTKDQIYELLDSPEHTASGGAEVAFEISNLCLWLSLAVFVAGAIVEARAKRK